MLRRLWKRLGNSNHGAKENRKIRHRPLRNGLEPLERRELLAIIIDTFAELQAMKDNLGGAYELAADINCAGNTFTPVGTGASPFTGSLDGKGYKIISLRTSSIGYGGDPYIGLFGHASGATLTDVVLENADIDAYGGSDYGYLYVGGLAGKATNTSITDCEVSGDIDVNAYGGVYAGGLVGYSSNTVHKDMLRSVTTCTVDGRADYNSYGGTGYGGYVGGLAGRADALDIDQCSATGAVTAYGGSTYGGEFEYAGGLVGYNYVAAVGGPNDGEILKSHATGNVQAYSAHAYGSLYAGGLIGYSYVGSSGAYAATTTVEECYATGTADAHGSSYSYGGTCPVAYAGGLIGYNYVTNSSSGSATSNVTLSYATGLADADAFGYGGSSYGGPSPYAFAGGLIGYNYDTSSSSGTATTTVDQSFATGTADAYASIPSYTYGGAYAYSGGLVGYNTVSSSSTGTASSTIDESYATGTVNSYAYGGYYYGGYGGYYYGSAYSGGLVGYEYLYKGASATASATISNAYATGNATAQGPYDAVAGGLIGLVTASGTNAAVTNCYSIGVPDAQYDSTPLEGGLVGYSSNVTYTSCYWDTTTSGKTDGVDNVDPDPSGVSGKTTAEMMTQSTFVGWDFDCDGLGACHNGVWIMAGYPHLQMEQKFKVGDSIHITNLAELQAMNQNLNEDYYIDVDINASATSGWNGGQGFVPIGTKDFPFTGTLDGQWHIISNFTINRPDGDEQGLIGYLDTRVGGTGGTVSRVRMENVSVTVYAPYVYPQYPFSDNTGGIAGKSEGTISDCYVTGTLDGNDDLGGIVGESQGGTVQRCYANITVPYHADSDNIGGLVGDNDGGTIRQSYSAGTIACAAWVGGLVGQSRGVIEDCYSTATVQGGSYAGGLVGKHYVSSGTSAVRRSYSTGTVTGTRYVGGFAGYVGSGAVVEDCFEIGNATGNYAYGPDVGTFMGGGYTANMTNNYYTGTATNTGGGGTNTSGATATTVQALTSQAHAVYTRTGDLWVFDANGAGPGANGQWIMAYLPHLQIEYNFIPTVGGAKSLSNVTQLQLMAVDLDAAYVLAGDIVCNSATDALNTAKWNWVSGTTYLGFQPIGRDTNNAITTFQAVDYQGNRFTGSLDGVNHSITGLYINRPDEDYIGLFGYLRDTDLNSGNWQARTADVQRLTITNPKIVGRRYVGGLAGLSEAKIQNCTVAAATYGQGSADGYVRLGGTMVDGANTFYAGFQAGGLVGKSSDDLISVIDTCTTQILVDYNTVSGHPCDVLNMGGLVGQDNDDVTGHYDLGAQIINSNADGDVIAQTAFAAYRIFGEDTNLNNHIGGLIGEHDGWLRGTVVGTQQYCTATGAVQGARNVGGLIGELDGRVDFSRATGTKGVQGRRSVGGLIGMIENTTAGQPGDSRDCSTTRPVTGLGTTTDAQFEHIGGFVGQCEGGLMLRGSASGAVSAPEHSNVGGFAGSLQVSILASARDHDDVLDPDVVLVAGEGYIYGSSASGAVTGRMNVGGFVGHNTDSTIQQCSATGAATLIEDEDVTVTADRDYRVGGFVGYNDNDDQLVSPVSDADISQCYATGNVLARLGTSTARLDFSITGASSSEIATVNICAGGFVGMNNDHASGGSYISDSYSKTGTVTVQVWAHDITGNFGALTTRVGGFAGRNRGGTGELDRCYSANGTVSSTIDRSGTLSAGVTVTQLVGGFNGSNTDNADVNYCYYDTQTTGWTTSAGGTGMTTAQMKNSSNYTTWNFTTIWDINTGEYPHLRWQPGI